MYWTIKDVDNVMDSVDRVKLQFDDITERLKKIREQLILQALNEGWKREDIEARLQKAEGV